MRKRLQNQDDFRKSLENGVVLCELLNVLRPGCIRKINRLPSKIAGIDNLNVFLQACSDAFSLQENQLFQVSDLEDLSEKIMSANQMADEQGKRIRRVLTTIFHLGKAATGLYDGPAMDFSAFSGIVTACPPPVSVVSTPMNDHQTKTSSPVVQNTSTAVARDYSPVNGKQSTGRNSANRSVDLSPTRNSDSGSVETGSNVSSSQNSKTAPSTAPRTSANSQYVKGGFHLPTGPSSLTKKAQEQMRMINESRQSNSFQPATVPKAQNKAVSKPAATANSTLEDDAWQSDLDMWRMRRKQSLQSTLPPEVLETVGLLDNGESNNDSAKKEKKKPGLMSKLKYTSVEEDTDPIVLAVDVNKNNNLKEEEGKDEDHLSNFTSEVNKQVDLWLNLLLLGCFIYFISLLVVYRRE